MVERGASRVLPAGRLLHRGMAREGRLAPSAAGPADRAPIRRQNAPSFDRITLAGGLCLAVVLAALAVSAQAQVTSTRMWPSRDYTRLTIEAQAPVKYEVLSVSNPDRIVLDLETDMTPALSELDGKLVADDPYVKGLRVARNRPGVVRVVLDLKTEVRPEVFTLPPVGEYGYRLVLDIHPLAEVDPLAQLIEESNKTPQRVARLATIVIDAGHGGEDPGALGRRGTREKDVTLMIAKRLKALVDDEPNMRALLTRDGDYFLPLDVRVEKARKVKADLLVS